MKRMLILFISRFKDLGKVEKNGFCGTSGKIGGLRKVQHICGIAVIVTDRGSILGRGECERS